MPYCGSYEVASREEAKVPRRDQSYRSCILALLIFFLLCIVLILSSWPWKKFHNKTYNVENNLSETLKIEGNELITTERSTEPNHPVKNTKNASKKSSKLLVPTEEPFDRSTVTKESTQLPVNSEEKFQRYVNNYPTKSTELPITPEDNFEQSTETSQNSANTEEHYDEFLHYSSTLKPQNNFSGPNFVESQTTIAKIESIAQDSIPRTSEQSIYNSHSTLANTETKKFNSNDEELLTKNSPPVTTENFSETTENFVNLLEKNKDSEEKFETTEKFDKYSTSLKKLLEAKYLGIELTTLSTEDVEENWLNVMEESDPQELLQSSKSAEFSSLTKNKFIFTSKSSSEGTTETEEIAASNSLEENVEELNICSSSKCKQISSKLVSYMNHSADPCEDFYEYSCGGMEADDQIIDKDMSRQVFDTIERQAKKYKDDAKYSRFNNYYDSCLKYEATFNLEHRIDLAREALEKIGKFYTTADWPEGFRGFTRMFTNMMLLDRPLIFDIVPDVNETNSQAFALKIGPVVDTKLFQYANRVDLCSDKNEETLKNSVNLDQLYTDYKNCKNNTRNFVTSIRQALSELGIFDSLKNTYNISQYVDRTVVNIDIDIIKEIIWKFPQESEIRDAYKSKRYTLMSLEKLQENCKFLNWTQLINSLTGLTLGSNEMLQVYFKDELIAAIRHLKYLNDKQPLELNNALLGLYARNIYQDLVATRFSRDLYRHCLYVSAHYMKVEASELYMSSFTDDEIMSMKSMLGGAFRELKKTLENGILDSEWTEGKNREIMLKKLSDIKILLPDKNLSIKKTIELNITDNYFVNSMNLMKKYRSMIYSAISKNPRHPEEIWTFFASPYDWNAQTIHGLSIIVLPFGAIDWSALSESDDPFNRLTRATIFNLNAIAQEIAHNFDTNGIRYWNGSRDPELAFLSDGDATKSAYDEYINCHEDSLYQEELSMSLPVTGQQVHFTIPRQTVNERLSDLVAMRLVNDTLVRLGYVAPNNERLPWLDLNVNQLFYLTYAQNFCTKSSLRSSFVSLHEDSSLPSRIRVFVVASNNKNLGDAWKCPEGSKITPAFMCDTFPHLKSQDNGLDAV